MIIYRANRGPSVLGSSISSSKRFSNLPFPLSYNLLVSLILPDKIQNGILCYIRLKKHGPVFERRKDPLR